MIFATENKDEIKSFEELDDLQPKVKEVRLVEKSCKQSFLNDIKEVFEAITEAVTDSNQKLLEEPKSKKKQLRNWMNQIKTLKL